MIRLALLLLALGALFALREPIWQLIGGPADQGEVDFASFTRSEKPNNYLICPENLCAASKPDAVAPVFPVPASALREALHAALASEPNLTRTAETETAERYVARTKLMRFPDTISVRFIPLTDSTSTIAIYSRSLIGYGDMGMNKKRVEDWLARLSF